MQPSATLLSETWNAPLLHWPCDLVCDLSLPLQIWSTAPMSWTSASPTWPTRCWSAAAAAAGSWSSKPLSPHTTSWCTATRWVEAHRAGCGWRGRQPWVLCMWNEVYAHKATEGLQGSGEDICLSPTPSGDIWFTAPTQLLSNSQSYKCFQAKSSSCPTSACEEPGWHFKSVTTSAGKRHRTTQHNTGANSPDIKTQQVHDRQCSNYWGVANIFFN